MGWGISGNDNKTSLLIGKRLSTSVGCCCTQVSYLWSVFSRRRWHSSSLLVLEIYFLYYLVWLNYCGMAKWSRFVIVKWFSIVQPIMKRWVLFELCCKSYGASQKTRCYLYLMHEYGRWTILGVMAVPVLIITVKLAAIVSIKEYFVCTDLLLPPFR